MKVYTDTIRVTELPNGDFQVSIAVNDSSLVIKTIKKKDMRKVYYQLKDVFDN